MPPRILYDLDQLKIEEVELGLDGIRKVNPQRFEFEQLTAVNKFLMDEGLIIGHRNIGHDEFWVRGHFPGRPLLPGVLMLECVGQLCTFYYQSVIDREAILGFGSADKVKFRGTVVPGDDLLIIGRMITLRRRTASFVAQALVGDQIVFECQIIGVVV